MTYPQQPFGGQSPYGQPVQPGSGHGPYDPYGQQPYGGGYGGGFPPPPPKKKTGAVVAVVVVVVLVLGGLGFTGFVEPGFFVGEGSTPGGTTTSSKTTSPSAEPAGADPEDFLRTLVDGLDTQDADALEDLTCADSASDVDSAVADIDSISGAELVDSEEVSDDEVTATIEVTGSERTGEVEVTITRDGGDWCWQDITRTGEDPTGDPTEPTNDPGTPTAGGNPVTPEALAAMRSFLDSINTGDAAAAKSTLCADAISTPAEVDALVGHEPSLEIDPSMEGIASGDKSVQLYLRGTVKGQELDGYSTNLWVTKYDGPWCVHAFRAVVI